MIKPHKNNTEILKCNIAAENLAENLAVVTTGNARLDGQASDGPCQLCVLVGAVSDKFLLIYSMCVIRYINIRCVFVNLCYDASPNAAVAY